MIQSTTLVLGICTFPGLCGLLSLDNIYSSLQDFTRKYPKIVQRFEIGKSFEGRPIYAIGIFRSQKLNHAKATMIVEFGIHAREWASPTSALYLLEQILTNPACEDYTQQLKWYVIPVTNPDGYHFSIKQDPLWRKNRRKFPNEECVGVDLNRNFLIGWDKRLSDDLCKVTYSGPNNFSEPESIAMRGFVSRIVQNENVSAYVAVHACAQSVLHPYGYTAKQPTNLELLQKVGTLMAAAIEGIAGNYYPVQAASSMYEAGGGSDDWAYEDQDIPLVYTLELGYSTVPHGRSCFHPTKHEMTTLVSECLAALGAVAKYLDPSIGRAKKNSSTAISWKRKSLTPECPSKAASSDANPFTLFRLEELILFDAGVISVIWLQSFGDTR